LAKQHQKQRVTEDVTDVTFNFTEGWFRTSGLYDLWPRYQKRLRIGKKIGWSREHVLHYVRLLDKVDTRVLDLAKQHQKSRVSENDTTVPIYDFTEGWFYTDGINITKIRCSGVRAPKQ